MTRVASLLEEWQGAPAHPGHIAAKAELLTTWPTLAARLDALAGTNDGSVVDSTQTLAAIDAELRWARESHPCFPTVEHGAFVVGQSIGALISEVANGAGNSPRARKLGLEAIALIIRLIEETPAGHSGK